ncbi:MAG: hypothetical protein AAFR87_34400 [Bacteroidota bacterium]
MKNHISLSLLGFLFFYLLACESEEEPVSPDCNNSQLFIQVTSFKTTPCDKEEGVIELTASGGSGVLEYSLDGINFSTQTLYEDLPSGRFQPIVRDENNCFAATRITLSSGVSFSNDIEELITATCAVSSCHVTGEQAPDFSLRANIFSAAPRIRTQLQANAMPPPNSGQEGLSQEETRLVICWINEGAEDN